MIFVTGCLNMEAVCLTGNAVFKSGLPYKFQNKRKGKSHKTFPIYQNATTAIKMRCGQERRCRLENLPDLKLYQWDCWRWLCIFKSCPRTLKCNQVFHSHILLKIPATSHSSLYTLVLFQFWQKSGVRTVDFKMTSHLWTTNPEGFDTAFVIIKKFIVQDLEASLQIQKPF